ncbi:transposase [Candidatus Acetothermia bacterium]|nr:transposase [Candidatus Acetothermia bacterium]
MFRVGVLKLFNRLDIAKARQGIPVQMLMLLWLAKALLGFKYVDNLQYMFRDKHLMRLCGFSPEQIKQGYSRRTSGRGRKPIHTDSVRNFGADLPSELSEKFFSTIVTLCQGKDEIKGNTFALDAKFISVEGKQMEKAALGFDPHANEVKTGYKLFLLQNIQQGHEYIICAALMPGNQDERPMLLRMVEKAISILGKDAIKLLLIDRGYLDAAALYTLKHSYGIDFIIPGEERLHAIQDAIALTKLAKHQFVEMKKGVFVAGCPDIGSYSSYGDEKGNRGTINVLLVKDHNTNYTDDPDRIFSYLTSLPMKLGAKKLEDLQALYDIYRAYKKRWVIENNAFKELSEHWNLTKKPGGKFNTICCHLYFTLAAYNLVLLFKSSYGSRFVSMSLSTFREKALKTADMVIVYAGELFAVFPLTEFMKLVKTGPPLVGPIE